MARVKRAVHGKKKRREVMSAAKGYYSARSRRYRVAKEQVMHSLAYAYRDRRDKKGHVERFLKQGAHVKVTIMFRGREMAHTDLGRKLLDRLTEDLKELATVESYPKLDGRNMIMVLAPVKRVAARVEDHDEAPVSEPERSASEA